MAEPSPGLRRLLWLALGYSAVGLGLIGIALPILPTTPFLILAAFAFSKSSPRLRNWLVEHPRFGPPIRDWEAHGAICPRHKLIAVGMMAALFVLSLILGLRPLVLGIQAVALIGAATFILTRPSGAS